jgi:hypothetical protein
MLGMNIKIIIVGPFRDYPKAPKKKDTPPRTATQTNGTKGPSRSKARQRSHTQCNDYISSKMPVR